MRLIDADALLKTIANSGLVWETNECIDVIELLAVKKIIDDSPTIEINIYDDISEVTDYSAYPVSEPERPKGKWITKPHVHGVTYCSECDFELKIDDTNYCPNCGARME